MPRLPRASSTEIISALERLGFAPVRRRGSHLVMARDTEAGRRVCVIPLHREVAAGTLRNALERAGISVHEPLDAL